jgi:hypothetical protein
MGINTRPPLARILCTESTSYKDKLGDLLVNRASFSGRGSWDAVPNVDSHIKMSGLVGGISAGINILSSSLE